MLFMVDFNSKKTLVIIAGEVSGDIHGSRLVAALKKMNPRLDIQGIGGDLMIKEGLQPLFHIKQMAFLGLGEILKHLPFIRKVFRKMTDLVKSTQPAAVILIDYPGFNLRFAKKMYKMGIPVIYYISPQLWAWGKKRVYKIQKYVKKMLVIFPFEKQFYNDYGIDADYVGHPIADNHFDHVNPKVTQTNGKTLGLLPGSRHQELNNLLPDMIKTAKMLKDSGMIKHVLLLKVDTISPDEYKKHIGEKSFIQVYTSTSESFFNQLDAALVSSGTATLETGYFRVPMVIVYRVNPLTWFFARLLVKVDVIGLVNIVAGEKIAEELLQNEFQPEKAKIELERLLDPVVNKEVRHKLTVVKEKLGAPGTATRAAQVINDFIS
jgi:lipid-A-disaccharide synthase